MTLKELVNFICKNPRAFNTSFLSQMLKEVSGGDEPEPPTPGTFKLEGVDFSLSEASSFSGYEYTQVISGDVYTADDELLEYSASNNLVISTLIGGVSDSDEFTYDDHHFEYDTGDSVILYGGTTDGPNGEDIGFFLFKDCDAYDYNTDICHYAQGYTLLYVMSGDYSGNVTIVSVAHSSAELTPFEVGQTISGYDFGDVQNGESSAEIEAFLSNLTYEPNCSLLLGGIDQVLLEVVDYTKYDLGYVLNVTVGIGESEVPIYSTFDYDDGEGTVYVHGWQNLTNGKIMLDKQYQVSSVNDTTPPTWNGVLIGAINGTSPLKILNIVSDGNGTVSARSIECEQFNTDINTTTCIGTLTDGTTTVTATPSVGYHFCYWELNNCIIGNCNNVGLEDAYNNVHFDDGDTIHAVFAQDQVSYILNAASIDATGTVAPSSIQLSTPYFFVDASNAGDIDDEENRVEASPVEAGYSFMSWYYDDKRVVRQSGNTVGLINDSTSVIAYFINEN